MCRYLAQILVQNSVCLSFWQLSLSAKCVSYTVVSGTIVMLASAVHIVAKYYHRPKRSSNKIRILQTKFELGKKCI